MGQIKEQHYQQFNTYKSNTKIMFRRASSSSLSIFSRRAVSSMETCCSSSSSVSSSLSSSSVNVGVFKNVFLPSSTCLSLRQSQTKSSSSFAEGGRFGRSLNTTAATKEETTSTISNEIEMKGITLRGRPMYLDMQATTPVDPRVLDAMLPYFVSSYGNPHSRTHYFGWEAENANEEARKNVADVIGATEKEIIFTSGATESNNMAIRGIANFYKSGGKMHVITTQTEHKCVLDSCRQLQQNGFDVTYLPVKTNGLIDLEELKKAIRPGETCLVSVMAVNNEIGVVQPLKEIGEICRANKVFFHTDGAQAIGKIPMDMNEMNIDIMSMSSHKIYGPKGIGAIYLRRRPRVRLEAQMSGGGQERGLRSGTLAPALCVGFGEACRVGKEEMEQ